MPFNIDFVHENRVIGLHLYGTVKESDFSATTASTFQLMEAGTYPVHALTTFDPDLKYPKNPQTIITFMKSFQSFHPKAGWAIQITENAMQRFLSTLVIQVVAGQIRHGTAENIEQALQFLKQRDAALESLDIPTALAKFDVLRKAGTVTTD